MAELKVYLPDELDQRFRKTAMKTYGYGRGSLSKTAVEALSKWCTDHEPSATVPDERTTKDERTPIEQSKDERIQESAESKRGESPPEANQTLPRQEHPSRLHDSCPVPLHAHSQGPRENC